MLLTKATCVIIYLKLKVEYYLILHIHHTLEAFSFYIWPLNIFLISTVFIDK